MDTEEMYRRGVADAERGEPHPFYYEHYYQYRRGYDRTRRSRGLPGGFYDQRRRRIARLAALGLLLAVGGGAFTFWRDRTASSSARQPNAPPTQPAPTRVPTHTPIFATATPQPTPTQPALQVGASAQVSNTQGATLRSRRQPSLAAPTTANFKEGERVNVLEGPIEADGFVWWRIEGPSGSGWSAQQSRDGLVWLEPVAP